MNENFYFWKLYILCLGDMKIVGLKGKDILIFNFLRVFVCDKSMLNVFIIFKVFIGVLLLIGLFNCKM